MLFNKQSQYLIKNMLTKIKSFFSKKINLQKNIITKDNSSVEKAIVGSSARPIGDVKSFLEDIKARGFQPQGILDIGANRGEWSKMALDVFSNVCVVMIEPQEEMVSSLSTLCRNNSSCSFYNCGAGAEDGELVLTIWEDTYGSSYTVPKSFELLKSGKQRVTSIRTVDGILAELGAKFIPSIVKIDTQGFELEILRGGKSLFGLTDVFIIETTLLVGSHPVWPSSREIIEYMGKMGYEIYDITSFLRKPSDGSLGQLDFAFVKEDGQFRMNLNW
jgi:FkbM family methyltransferase